VKLVVALVTGVAGQAGWCLSRLLLERGCEVVGCGRPGTLLGRRGDELRALGVRLVASAGVALVLAAPLVVLGQRIITLWGRAGARPARRAPLWMGVWSVVLAPSRAIACILNGSGHLRGQMICGLTSASLTVVPKYGITGVIAATVVAWLVCGALPAALESLWVLCRLAPEHARG
jgi:NAD(P)-dependent dehydrogenase (short-subunit alcohol dehydrogenase family)